MIPQSGPVPTVLYVSYDGMLEPLGQSQVLPYIEHLANCYKIYLVSFEKRGDRADKARMGLVRKRLIVGGIVWIPLTYHKTPSALATSFDVGVGMFVALWVVVRHRVQIVHARSYVPALMALLIKRLTGSKFLFDMRGFWADERVDGRLWSADGFLYRLTKWLERRFLLAADHVVTLTHASVRELARFPYLEERMPAISVIPTCANLNFFCPDGDRRSGPFTLGYVGSVGTWYLFDEVLTFFKAIRRRRPDARLLVVNRNDHAMILDAVARAGIDPACLEIRSAEHRDVPTQVLRMDAGTAIIKPSYSKVASAPTKLAEYLGCGVPCVGNVNVGDMEEVLEGERVGIVLRSFSFEAHDAAADRLLALIDEAGTAARCVVTARRLFSLEVGVAAYRNIYRSLACK